MFSARSRLALPTFLAACLAAAPAIASQALTGLWLDQSGRAAIDIERCGTSVCGTILWLKEPLTPAGADGGWKNGFIYDPVSGKTYNANIHLAPDGTLAVRGYWQYTFLGKSQTWTRPPAPLPKCS